MITDFSTMSLDKLRHKRDQSWELAGCARVDGDSKEEKRHTDEARIYSAEIGRRMAAGVGENTVEQRLATLEKQIEELGHRLNSIQS